MRLVARRTWVFTAMAVCLLAGWGFGAHAQVGPGREMHTVSTDRYEISMRRDRAGCAGEGQGMIFKRDV